MFSDSHDIVRQNPSSTNISREEIVVRRKIAWFPAQNTFPWCNIQNGSSHEAFLETSMYISNP